MAESAVYLVDELIPLVPVRQFVVTFPPPLRLWLARSAELATTVCAKVIECLNRHLQRESGVGAGLTGCVVFMQRFGSAANLNVHLHIIALDGAYEKKSTGRLKFYNTIAPTKESTTKLVHDIAKRINNHLLRKGYLEHHEDLVLLGNTEEIFACNNDELHLPAQAASVGHRIAFGPNAGKPVRRLKLGNSLWPSEDDVEVSSDACVNVGGYSVHAATAVKLYERDRLERLVRYMARPAIADERLSVLPNGDIKLKLKTPWRDGTESILFTPSEFIERLIALIPIPRFHLTRYYGVLAARSEHRKSLPDRPERKEAMDEDSPPQQPPLLNKKRGKKRVGWAALLKRTFKIDVLQCHKCGSRMQLVDVVLHAALIATTLKAIGVSPRAPPIAPARSVGVFGFDEAFIDSDCIDLAYNNEETLSS